MIIEVTAKDIANGIPQTTGRHPLEIAFARAYNRDYIASSFDGFSFIISLPISTQIRFDKDLREYRSNFDRVNLSYWEERRPHPLRKPSLPITIKVYPDTTPHPDRTFKNHLRAHIVKYHELLKHPSLELSPAQRTRIIKESDRKTAIRNQYPAGVFTADMF